MENPSFLLRHRNQKWHRLGFVNELPLLLYNLPLFWGGGLLLKNLPKNFNLCVLFQSPSEKFGFIKKKHLPLSNLNSKVFVLVCIDGLWLFRWKTTTLSTQKLSTQWRKNVITKRKISLSNKKIINILCNFFHLVCVLFSIYSTDSALNPCACRQNIYQVSQL